MDVKIASVISLLSSGGLCYLGYLIRKSNNQLKEYESHKVYSPSSLVNEVQKKSFLENITKNPDNPDEYLLNAFVEGYVECKKPIKSKLDGKTDLVYSVYYKRDICSNDSLAEIRG